MNAATPKEHRKQFTALLGAVRDAGEDFEWYPTTDRMIAVVARHIPTDFESIMDIGAGDGRVLLELAKRSEKNPKLYAIEKSSVLIQAQPESVIPVGTDLLEQNLACLPVDYIFCNPPYSAYALWADIIIESAHARRAFLVLPRRWIDSKEIAAALQRRDATTRVIHSDDFQSGADRTARAVVDIVEVSFPRDSRDWNKVKDPFDIWFDQHISTFDAEEVSDYQSTYEREQQELARIRAHSTIAEMVAAYDEEYARMESNYRAIFRLDYALLRELSINKDTVREGIKMKMAGLKTKYWMLLFERLDGITSRLSTATKKRFLEKLTGRACVAFTANNAYAIVLWSIKNANAYFNEQLVELFRELSTFNGVLNYKSNLRTWEQSKWRFRNEGPSHYALDYRIVVESYNGAAIYGGHVYGTFDYPGNLHRRCHELLDDTIAVLGNLGFSSVGDRPRDRIWESGQWQDWHLAGTDDVLFQAKAFKNGNVHFRFMPDAIKALNVEAGRLLGWLRGPKDVEEELGYSAPEAARFFGCMQVLGASGMKLLEGYTSEPALSVAPDSPYAVEGV